MLQQNQQIILQNSLIEEQPPHPKTFTHIPLRSNNKKINILSVKQKLENNHIFVKTARQSFKRQEQKPSHRGLYTSRNSRIISVKAPSNNDSPKAHQDSLFIPQRKKFNQSNKFLSQKKLLKQKSTSFHVSPRLKQSEISINFFQKNEYKNPLFKKNLKSISSQQNRAIIQHISQLRKYQNTQKQRQTQLNNRLKFFTVQQQRETKRLQFVKRKYEKVVAVRSQFIKEKQLIQKSKIVNYLQQMNEKHKKISKIKEQQKEKNLSISRVSQTKSLEASRLRSEERSIIFQRRKLQMNELKKKQQLVKASQLRQKMARQKLIQVNRSRIETIRSIENKQIVKSYLNVTQKEKMNKKLQERLQKQISLINEKKQRSTNQLKKYEQFLGLRKKKHNQNNSISKNKIQTQESTSFNTKNDQKPRTGSTTYCTSRSKSFYITNY